MWRHSVLNTQMDLCVDLSVQRTKESIYFPITSQTPSGNNHSVT
jgi:hypothetical protein